MLKTTIYTMIYSESNLDNKKQITYAEHDKDIDFNSFRIGD